METTRHPIPHLALILCSLLVALATSSPAAGGYGWPVKPFHRQHAVRGYFGDPRIGADGRGGTSRSLHFGIDISAPNGTSVFATISGRISRHPLHPKDVLLVSSGNVTFEYWHIVPVVDSGYAVAYRTLIGRVEAPWLHVHFSERHGSTYLNPLRPGGLTPYGDTTRPVVRDLGLERHGARVDLVAEVYDTTPLPVPKPWNDKPVTPALVEYRVRGPHLTGRWTVASDFRGALPARSFDAVYTSATSQNHAPSCGRYRFVLARGWQAAPGSYLLDVRVCDTAGNAGTRSVTLQVGSELDEP
jgi:hypothetical protein